MVKAKGLIVKREGQPTVIMTVTPDRTYVMELENRQLTLLGAMQPHHTQGLASHAEMIRRPTKLATVIPFPTRAKPS